MRFKVLTWASTKIRAFWDIGPCSLGVYRRYRGTYCRHHQDDEFIRLCDGGNMHV
jgi:hypothetical protein